jgi:hypothetical protein
MSAVNKEIEKEIQDLGLTLSRQRNDCTYAEHELLISDCC